MDIRQNTRVLIVEDDFLVGEMIHGLLEEMEYAVVGKAMDGLQAIEMTQSLRPDVILMDIELPDLDGIEATRQLYESCPTPVVVLTAYDTLELVERASAAGVGAYLVKPPNALEMERAITITMSRFRDMMELRRLNADLQAEITERKRAEEQLKVSLEEKEVLLHEVNHRVKNNMQVLSSMLNLQENYVKDKQTLEILKDIRTRVRTMGLVHEKLYQSQDLAKINFAEYISDLTVSLFRAYNINANAVRLNFALDDDILFDIKTAIPCGLILNELVSNSLKHAFPKDKEGEVHIELTKDDDSNVTLIVSNNGVDFPEDLDFRNTESLGLQLVNILTQQLNGTIELDKSGGTAFKITFKPE